MSPAPLTRPRGRERLLWPGKCRVEDFRNNLKCRILLELGVPEHTHPPGALGLNWRLLNTCSTACVARGSIEKARLHLPFRLQAVVAEVNSITSHTLEAIGNVHQLLVTSVP